MVCSTGTANAVNGDATPGMPCGGGGGTSNGGGGGSSMATDYAADSKLRRIADEIREILPLNAIMPTEQITFPSIGEVRCVDKLTTKLSYIETIEQFANSLFSSLSSCRLDVLALICHEGQLIIARYKITM